MIINTKYELLQNVWVITEANLGTMGHEPEVDCRTIHGIFIDHQGIIFYHLEKYRGPFRFKYQEAEVFPTEDALLTARPEFKKTK